MGVEKLETLRTGEMRVNSTNPGLIRVQVTSELLNALEGYDALLANGLPGHARAMMQRQRQTLTLLLHDLEQLIGGYTPRMLKPPST